MFLVLTWQTQKTNIYYECTLTKIFTYRLYMLYNFLFFIFSRLFNKVVQTEMLASHNCHL